LTKSIATFDLKRSSHHSICGLTDELTEAIIPTETTCKSNAICSSFMHNHQFRPESPLVRRSLMERLPRFVKAFLESLVRFILTNCNTSNTTTAIATKDKLSDVSSAATKSGSAQRSFSGHLPRRALSQKSRQRGM
jgi:hypothetical protein